MPKPTRPTPISANVDASDPVPGRFVDGELLDAGSVDSGWDVLGPDVVLVAVFEFDGVVVPDSLGEPDDSDGEPVPVLVPDPDGEPVPVLVPDPDGEPVPVLVPDPDGEPVPVLVPDPDGEPVPVLVPDPDGEPVPVLVPDPDGEPAGLESTGEPDAEPVSLLDALELDELELDEPELEPDELDDPDDELAGLESTGDEVSLGMNGGQTITCEIASFFVGA